SPRMTPMYVVLSCRKVYDPKLGLLIFSPLFPKTGPWSLQASQGGNRSGQERHPVCWQDEEKLNADHIRLLGVRAATHLDQPLDQPAVPWRHQASTNQYQVAHALSPSQLYPNDSSAEF